MDHWWRRRESRSPYRCSYRIIIRSSHGPRDLTDDRREGPGTHRASPAELAVHDRVAREESRSSRSKRFNALAVGAVDHVGEPRPDRRAEGVQLLHDRIGVDSGRPNSDRRRSARRERRVHGDVGRRRVEDVQLPRRRRSDVGADDGLRCRTSRSARSRSIPTHPDTLYRRQRRLHRRLGRHDVQVDRTAAARGARRSRSPARTRGVPATSQSIRQIGVEGHARARRDRCGSVRVERCRRDVRARRSAERQRRRRSPSRCGASSPVGGGGWVAGGVTACGVGAPPPGVIRRQRSDARAARSATTPRCGAPTTARRGRRSRDCRASPAPVARRSPSVRRRDPAQHASSTRSSAIVDGSKTARLLALRRTAARRTSTRPARSRTRRSRRTRTTSCIDINVGHDQTWYNQAIVVDPTNADHVLVGGNLCGMRTLNGTAASPTWENVSHWLPGHRLRRDRERPAARTCTPTGTPRPRSSINGHVATFAGTDGGLFASTTCSTRDAGRAGRVDAAQQGPRDAPVLLGGIRRSGDRQSVRRVLRPAGQRHAVPRRSAPARRRSTSRSAATASARPCTTRAVGTTLLGERRVPAARSASPPRPTARSRCPRRRTTRARTGTASPSPVGAVDGRRGGRGAR